MKTVTMADFKTPKIHPEVKDIVFRKDDDEKCFELGLLPENEFIYHFDVSPDVFFRNLTVDEVYFDPYRTFLRLKDPVTICLSLDGNGHGLLVQGE
jgi:hypothetical protein